MTEVIKRCLAEAGRAASYDIAKDGEVVAVLTLIKSTFRLGETVLCVVTFNERQTERRVLKVSNTSALKHEDAMLMTPVLRLPRISRNHPGKPFTPFRQHSWPDKTTPSFAPPCTTPLRLCHQHLTLDFLP